MRLGAVFIAICMVIIAGSAGAAIYFYFGVSVSEAVTVAIATLTALALYNTLSSRVGAGAAAGHQLADLSHGVADLARQVGEMGRRLAAMETKVEATLDRARAVTDPLTMEIGELGTLLKELAETVDAHQTALDEIARTPAAPPPGVLAAEALAQLLAAEQRSEAARAPKLETQPQPSSQASPQVSSQAAFQATSQASPEFVSEAPPAAEAEIAHDVARAAPAASAEKASDDAKRAADEAMLASIRGAIDANRVDLYLQPIVTLPQRKVRYYEAMSRLRTDRGEVLHAAEFVPHAETAMLMPKIDNLVIFRCVQVVRRLLLKNRDIGLFCNIAGSTLTDSRCFSQLLEFMDANRAIAPSLVLEFTQGAVRGMGPIEHESLAALSERGFRFSLDNVNDLRIDPRELANRGFRFIKIQASLLLNRAGPAATDIHPADLSDLVGRFGIDLIAEKIESEGSVVDLLDYDVRYGQGFLFSPPRPVRAEALQGIADRSDVVARDGESQGPERVSAAEPSRAERITGLAQLARGFVSRG
jgi:cyclic-di-GMP phosphodiesterase, flagellum assembly factor TipF